MSYCHGCADGYANQMYTFGGLYDGSGTKSDLANWINNPDLEANYNAVRYSVDPRREAHRMYTHVLTRGNNCLAVPNVQTPAPTKSPVTPQPTPKPVTPAPVTASPTKSPVTLAPVTSSPTKNPVTPQPTRQPVTSAPVTSAPTKSPVTLAPVTPSPTSAPTKPANCDDPNITQQQCQSAPNCEWFKVKRNWSCRFAPASPSPTTPSPTKSPTQGGGGTCDPTGAPCSSNCCFGCQTKGRWAGTCK
jgi:hypothetical protein